MGRNNKKHLKFVSQLPCCVSGKYPVHVHHLMRVPGEKRGMGMKVPDRFTIPLHYTAHDELHKSEEESYLLENEIDGIELANELYELGLRDQVEEAIELLEKRYTMNWIKRSLKCTI